MNFLHCCDRKGRFVRICPNHNDTRPTMILDPLGGSWNCRVCDRTEKGNPMELRTLIDSEIRVEERADGPSRIVGYAARIYRKSEPGTQYELAPGIVERIMPGAFDRALARGDDVRALFNHDPNLLLGRTRSGTLELSKDSKGLKYRITPNDETQVTNDVKSHIGRGDMTGSSFAFTIEEEEWRTEGKNENRVDIREIKSVRLYDVSPVTYPAYEATSVGLRAAGSDDWKAAHAEFRKSEEAETAADLATFHARAVVAGLR